ncbi:agmatine deiminase family protein [Rhodococcus pseudokoreensis]|uniref:Agmatine deiminase family protein n=1 Tax=Rhodococcus pseudokoreensis TaxID=2811421 RepID=A0A974ZZ95_9NOCA|nr:agmatine deiminase family protein [Rhodococcus pseudokoreensis]QSE95800.1 agmatine deiminase family protein [Rhodococcus pseudokoreensis]
MLRRRFIQSGLAAVGGLLVAACTDPVSYLEGGSSTDEDDQRMWRMPEEGEPHKRTWMAFGASEEIWGAELLPEVRRNLATIAQTIAQFEPVSMLVREEELDLARGLVGPAVELVTAPLDDLWMRDTGPVFVEGNGVRAGVNFNFNGWGEKQDFDRDAGVADVVTRHAGVESLPTDLILEGGGIEVDGEGTAIITESCVLNNNRNPGWSKADVEAELGPLLGLDKIIWLPGIAGKDITDGHTDFYARFARPGVVVAGYDPDPESFDHDVTTRHLEILETAVDAQGRPLEVVVLEAPGSVRPAFESDDFAAGYINFYVCNGAVIAPEFGDPVADKAARQVLERLFPDRRVVQIDIDAIAAGGGGIHCTTQQEPAG